MSKCLIPVTWTTETGSLWGDPVFSSVGPARFNLARSLIKSSGAFVGVLRGTRQNKASLALDQDVALPVQDTHWTHLSAPTSWLLLALCCVAFIVLALRNKKIDRGRRLLKTVAEKSNDGLLLQRMDGTIIWCNAAFCKTFGRSRDFWIGKKPQKWVYPKDKCPSDEEIENFRYDLNAPDFHGFTVRDNIDAQGNRFWNQLSLNAVDMGEVDPVIVLSCRDISEQVQRERALSAAKDRLELAVNYDSLTGLANRRKLMVYLKDALIQANENKTCVGLIAVDLDKFKETNDTHGHAAGDAVLMDAARILGESVSDACLAARTGGDEFVLVVPNVRTASPLRAVAKDILSKVLKPVLWEGKSLNYGASIGLAVSQPGQLDSEELIQKADFALYDAKNRGRGTYSIYDSTLQREHVQQKRLAEDLAHVIRSHGMEFHFQPIIDLASMSVCGVETLARWNHPKRGVITPIEFLAIAEDIGLLQDVDMAAMQAALNTYAVIRDMGMEDVYVSFNASFQTLSKSDLVDALKWETANADIPPSGIAVEVLETVLIGDEATESDVACHIQELVAAGFHTRLDDFGTGYAGLKHLAQLETQGIKIDRSLIRSILVDEASDIIVRAIMRLARSLRMDVIAEGVEDIQIAQKLKGYGCTAIQGFVVARPMPLEELKHWLVEFERHPLLLPQVAGKAS